MIGFVCRTGDDNNVRVYFVHNVYIAISVNFCLRGVWESSLMNVSMCDWLLAPAAVAGL